MMNLKRIMRAGFSHFYRNGFVSLSSILVMVVTLFTIGAVLFLSAILGVSLEVVKSKVDVNVYFQTKAPEEEILSLADSLRALPEVSSVEYLSREVVLTNFKERHKNDELTLQALAELSENPLGAVLNIRAYEPSQYAGIASFLKQETLLSNGSSPIIDEVNYYDNKTAIDALTRITDSVELFGSVLLTALVIISFMITFNTIRLAIYISRDEIGVMRLVGARNFYIRGPFVVSGILYGLSASILTLMVFYPLTYYLGDSTANFFSGLNIFSYYLSHFGEFFLVIVFSGIALGAVSSYLAVRRYLNL